MVNKENKLACAGHLPENLHHLTVRYLSSTPVILGIHRQQTHNQNIWVSFLRFLRTVRQWTGFIQQEFEIQCILDFLEKAL